MNTRLQYLFDRFLDKSCTAEEKQELMGLALEANMQGDLQQVIAAADRSGQQVLARFVTSVLMVCFFILIVCATVLC